MYLEINGKKYPCGKPGLTDDTLTWPEVENLKTPVTGMVKTCANYGFALREDDPGDWARQTYEGNILTFTNLPEPPPPPEPQEQPEPADPALTNREITDILITMLGAEENDNQE